MKHLLLAAVCSLALAAGATLAIADDAAHNSGGLGFHNASEPLGVRWWLAGQKVGIDAAVGFSSTPVPGFPKEKEMGWGVDVGVPLVIKSWDMVHVLFRPGFIYSTQEIKSTSDGGATFTSIKPKTWDVQAEIEAEVFLRDNVSVSAAHGVAYESTDPDISGAEKENSFFSTGNNFTTIGFHVYLFGSK